MVVAALGVGATYLPPVVWPDAPAPPSLVTSVPGARHDLWVNASPLVPLHLTFVEARCSKSGAVALVFEEHRLPYLGTHFAIATRGSMPTSPLDEAWSGGIGISGSVVNDQEFLSVMGTESTVCE